MNYAVIYDKLIDHGRTIPHVGYTENHHIIPRCMNGSDDQRNIVRLSGRAHYVAHRLLVKMYPANRKLLYALWRLTHDRRRQIHIDSRAYARLRECIAKECKSRFTGKKLSAEHIQKLRLCHLGRKHTSEHIELRRLANQGSKRTEETKEHLRDAWDRRKTAGTVKVWNKGKRYTTGPKPNMRGVQNSTKLTSSLVAEIRALFGQQIPIDSVGVIQRNGKAMSYIQAFSKQHAPTYHVSPQCLKRIITKASWPDGIQTKR